MTDLVVISLENWDEVWRRNQHLIAGLLQNGTVGRVLFVEPAIDALHEIRRGRRLSVRGRGLRKVRLEGGVGELWAYRPLKSLPRRLDPHGDTRRAREVKRVAQSLSMKDPVLWVNDPGGAEVMDATGWTSLYDITDDWLVADRPTQELSRLRRQESRLFERTREVVVCSESLRVDKSAYRPVVLVPNAVDLAPYRKLAPRPLDLPPARVALYVGTTHRDRVDVDLCIRTASVLRREDAHLVLVGPHPLSSSDLGALREAGVMLLGPRRSNEVPAYLQHADVLLVPHVVSDFTQSLDPIKAYEYAAANRLVVSTPVQGFVDRDDRRVLVVEATSFPEAVANTLSAARAWSPPDESAIPSWADRVEMMGGVLSRLNGRPGTGAE